MPGPSTIVTFFDADGDEFPIRVGGHWESYDRPQLIAVARGKLDDLVAANELKPTEPLVGRPKVERL